MSDRQESGDCEVRLCRTPKVMVICHLRLFSTFSYPTSYADLACQAWVRISLRCKVFRVWIDHRPCGKENCCVVGMIDVPGQANCPLRVDCDPLGLAVCCPEVPIYQSWFPGFPSAYAVAIVSFVLLWFFARMSRLSYCCFLTVFLKTRSR